MSTPRDTDRLDSRPLLLRFLQPLDGPSPSFDYDAAAGVNVLAASGVPAVRGGCDAKTLGAAAED